MGSASSAIVIPAIFLLVLNVALMVPYLLIGVMEGGLTLNYRLRRARSLYGRGRFSYA